MRNSMNKVIEELTPGDLVCCCWCDASVGKSSGSGLAIDVPVKSWGIYVGLIGDKVKHIVLAQNSFRFADGLFDLDYTAIPLSWTVEVTVIVREHVPKDGASLLVNSFINGGRRSINRPRIFRKALAQRRLRIDVRPN